MADLVKYVAAGFLDDAERLLRDFMKENSMQFSIFAEVWKRHNFSLVYAGRANGKELREFTLEIFQLSVNFLKSSSLLYQVGGTFLLYALYRNQILTPPLKIRITPSLFEALLTLLEVSRIERNRSLHYVIDYLVENAFDFVFCPKLKGPNSIKNEFYKDSYIYHPKIQESDVKCELTEIAENNTLHKLDELFTQYEVVRQNVQSLNSPSGAVAYQHPSLKDLALSIDKLLKDSELSDEDSNDIVKEAEESFDNPPKEESAIGSRRAQLKAAAFSNPANHYLSHGENATSCISEGNESTSEIAPKPPRPPVTIRLRRRVRRGRKKVGRPKKLLSEGSMSEEELRPIHDQSLQEQGFSGRRRRRARGPEFTKLRHYYGEHFAEYNDLNLPSTSNFLQKEYLSSNASDISE